MWDVLTVCNVRDVLTVCNVRDVLTVCNVRCGMFSLYVMLGVGCSHCSVVSRNFYKWANSPNHFQIWANNYGRRPILLRI